MSSRIAVLVPCTDGKRGVTVPVELRQVSASSSVSVRAVLWQRRLARAPEDLPAVQRYKGVGWSASLELVDTVRATNSTVARTMSAGLGLIDLNTPTPNYSATFVPGLPDSVAVGHSRSAANRAWWAALDVHGSQGTPIADLADQVDGLVIAASSSYIDAVGGDLAAAAEKVPTVIFTSGRPRELSLKRLAPHFDRRLREGPHPLVSGNDQNLNQRVAAAVWTELGAEALDVAASSRFLEMEMRKPPPIRRERAPRRDEEVAAFIVEALQSDPGASKGALLRRWRDSGNACEQRRFGDIYAEVRSSSVAGVTQ